MAKFKCKACQHEFDLQRKIAPSVCPACGKMGTCADVSVWGSGDPGSPLKESRATAGLPSSAAPEAPQGTAGQASSGAPGPAPPTTRPKPKGGGLSMQKVRERAKISDPLPQAGELPPSPPTPLPQAGEGRPDRLAWRYLPSKTAGKSSHPLRGCPAVDSEGRIFASVHDRLLMFLPGSQTPEWEYRTGGPIPRSPAIGPDGHVRVHSSDGCLHVVGADGKKVIDPVAVGEPLGWASPLVDQQNNTYLCRSEGGVFKVPAGGDSTSRPFVRTRRRFDCTGLILGETLYLGCEDHYLYAVPLGRDRGENAWADCPECGRTRGAINAPLALAAGPELLVASQDDQLYAFGLDGREHWSVALPGQMLGSPVVDEDGMIFAGISQNPRNQDSRGMLIAIEPRRHRITWQYRADAPVESTPVIGDDRILYFGDNAGTIHAVDANGQLVWKSEFEAPVRSSGTIVTEGRVAFGLDDGSLVFLECSSTQVRARCWPKFLGSLHQSGLADRG